MQEKPTRKFLDRWGRGLVLSVALHLIILVVFLMKLPALPEVPQEEESVAVELVPPPEEEKPAEEPKQEEEQAAEPPPPPPPLPVEENKAEEPPPTIPVLNPATLFGEKDSSTRPDLRGDVEEEANRPVETPPVEEEPQPEAAKADEVPAEAEPENTTESVEQPADGGAVEEGETEFPTDQALALAAPPSPKPAKPTKSDSTAEAEVQLVPKPVKRIYSASVADDLVTMSAMAGESRGERINRLCGTELKAQLSQASPSRNIKWAPEFNLRSGNVINAPQVAFGDWNGEWYNLAMRCTVDDDATRVVDFNFAVGAPVPRSEWKKRGFRIN